MRRLTPRHRIDCECSEQGPGPKRGELLAHPQLIAASFLSQDLDCQHAGGIRLRPDVVALSTSRLSAHAMSKFPRVWSQFRCRLKTRLPLAGSDYSLDHISEVRSKPGETRGDAGQHRNAQIRAQHGSHDRQIVTICPALTRALTRPRRSSFVNRAESQDQGALPTSSGCALPGGESQVGAHSPPRRS